MAPVRCGTERVRLVAAERAVESRWSRWADGGVGPVGRRFQSAASSSSSAMDSIDSQWVLTEAGQSGEEPRRWNPRLRPWTRANRMGRGVVGVIWGISWGQVDAGMPGSAASASAHCCMTPGADGCDRKVESARRDWTRADLSAVRVAARTARWIQGSWRSCLRRRVKALRVSSPPMFESARAAWKRIRGDGWDNWERTRGMREDRSGRWGWAS